MTRWLVKQRKQKVGNSPPPFSRFVHLKARIESPYKGSRYRRRSFTDNWNNTIFNTLNPFAYLSTFLQSLTSFPYTACNQTQSYPICLRQTVIRVEITLCPVINVTVSSWHTDLFTCVYYWELQVADINVILSKIFQQNINEKIFVDIGSTVLLSKSIKISVSHMAP